MTLQQLKYAIQVADKGSISLAAKSLFIAQPSLSAAIHELEAELGFSLFYRQSRGVVPTPQGMEFLGYARQVAQQTELLEEKYLSGKPQRQRFSVSTQHYPFTANAFVELIREFGSDEYEFALRETTTHNIITDVRTLRSEIGVLYLSSFNRPVLTKLFKESNLIFTPLLRASPHILISRHHPLAQKPQVTLHDLEDYPCILFDQGEHNSFYFAEEILSTTNQKRTVHVTDRAAVINLMIGINAYHIATGIFPSYLHGEEIVAVPLQAGEEIEVGTLAHRDMTPTRLGKIYLAALQQFATGSDGAQ